MARVWLRDILSAEHGGSVMGLRRGPDQDRYLNSMEEIFAGADDAARVMGARTSSRSTSPRETDRGRRKITGCGLG